MVGSRAGAHVFRNSVFLFATLARIIEVILAAMTLNLERGFRRVVTTLSIALVCVGLGLTGYESYLTVQYVSAYGEWSRSSERRLACLRATDAQADRTIPPARDLTLRRWRAYQRHVEEALREAQKDSWALPNPAKERSNMEQLQEVLRRYDSDFAAAPAEVERLLVFALIKSHEEKLHPEQIEEERWWRWAYVPFSEKYSECPHADALPPWCEPCLWGVPWDGDSNEMVVFPLILGLVLSAGLGALPWGVFCILRWIARGFRDERGAR